MKNQIIYILIITFLFSCKNAIKKADILENKNDKIEIFQSVLDSIYASNKDSVGLIVHIEAPDKNISWSERLDIQIKTIQS